MSTAEVFRRHDVRHSRTDGRKMLEFAGKRVETRFRLAGLPRLSTPPIWNVFSTFSRCTTSRDIRTD